MLVERVEGANSNLALPTAHILLNSAEYAPLLARTH